LNLVISFLWLIVFLFVILIGADVFTNSIEWLGAKLKLNEGVLGSVLAAVGTALPETLVPIIAVLTVGVKAAGDEIGTGSILGAPFMLSTLAMFITGLTAYILVRQKRRGMSMAVDLRLLRRDIIYFLAPYTIAILAAFLPAPLGWLKPVIAVGLLLFYAFYVYKQITDGGATADDAEDLSPLHFARKNSNPPLWLIIGQVVIGVGLIAGGAYFFVQNIQQVATALGIAPVILSLLIVPYATELPEKVNSVLWVRKGKDTLALGNITGAMVFQSCIPVAFGLAFTEWSINSNGGNGNLAFFSGAITIMSGIFLLTAMRVKARLSWRTLMFSGSGYFIYLIFLLFTVR